MDKQKGSDTLLSLRILTCGSDVPEHVSNKSLTFYSSQVPTCRCPLATFIAPVFIPAHFNLDRQSEINSEGEAADCQPDGMKHSVVFMLVTQLLCRSLAYSKPLKSPAARVTSMLDVLALDRHHRHSQETICEKTDWRKHVMKLIKEVPFIGILRDLKKETKFEASGLVHVNDTYYVVFDRRVLSPSCLMFVFIRTDDYCMATMLQSPKSWCYQ